MLNIKQNILSSYPKISNWIRACLIETLSEVGKIPIRCIEKIKQIFFFLKNVDIFYYFALFLRDFNKSFKIYEIQYFYAANSGSLNIFLMHCVIKNFRLKKISKKRHFLRPSSEPFRNFLFFFVL